MQITKDSIRAICWDKTLDCLGFWYIYSKRIANLSMWLRWTKVFGILVPVLVGGMVASYYGNPQLINLTLIITTPLALCQLVISTYLTVIGADEDYYRYSTKAVEFNLLHSEFEQLAKFPIDDFEEYKRHYEILIERERGVTKDIIDIKDKELRMGMRFGLRDTRRSCAGCNKVPISLKPSDCDVCGNF